MLSLELVPRLIVIAWATVIVSTLLLFAVQTQPEPDDLVPFYCASGLIAQGVDPYEAAAISRCESAVWNNDWRARRWITPAPIPPLALAALSPISSVPFPTAVRLWRITILLATLVTAFLMSRISKAPFALTAAAMTPIGIIDNGFNGQPVALTLLFIVAAAYALRLKNAPLAALFAIGSLAEPHIGLPVCIGLFLWFPKSRIWITSFLALALIASTVVLPAHLTVEYIASVLPAHALAEATWYQQYSFTYLLTSLGVPLKTAVTLGSASYVAAVSTGLYATMRSRNSDQPIEGIVLIPAAFAIAGGAYIHIFQIIAALPAAFLLWTTAEQQKSWRTNFCIFLLSIPWMKVWVPGMIAIVILMALSVIHYTAEKRKNIVAACILTIAFTLLYWNVRPVATIPRYSVHFSSSALVDEPYAQYISMAMPNPVVSHAALLAKFPTWAGLGILAMAYLARSSSRQRKLEAT